MRPMADRDDAPRRLNGVWTEMPFLRGRQGAERLVEGRALTGEAHDLAVRRRTAVLAHPWARRKLCLIMGYQNAEQWTGYIPPRAQAQGHVRRGTRPHEKPTEDVYLKPNDSRERAELLALVDEVDEYNRKAADGGANPDDQA